MFQSPRDLHVACLKVKIRKDILPAQWDGQFESDTV
jgi:hypothetical protein